MLVSLATAMKTARDLHREMQPLLLMLSLQAGDQDRPAVADHLSMGMSLIASTRGVGLLPVYAEKFLASSLRSRPLKGRHTDRRSGPRLQTGLQS